MSVTYHSDISQLMLAIVGIGEDRADSKPLLEEAERSLRWLIETHRSTTFHLRMMRSILLSMKEETETEDIEDFYGWFSPYRRAIGEYNEISILPFEDVPNQDRMTGYFFN